MQRDGSPTVTTGHNFPLGIDSGGPNCANGLPVRMVTEISRLTRFQIPDDDRSVFATADQRLTLVSEIDRDNGLVMLRQCFQELARLYLPNLEGGIPHSH